MKVHDQVCSLELSRKLCELGVKQDSCFYWAEAKGLQEIILAMNYKDYHEIYHLDPPEIKDKQVNSASCDCCSRQSDVLNKYAAYTVAELGELLPGNLNHGKYRLEFIKGGDDLYIYAYVESNDLPPFCIFVSKNEADARAKMLIYLIESKLIEL